MMNRKLTTNFPTSYRWSAYLSPPKVALKPFFSFRNKFNFYRIKSATKFHCVKTSSGKVVEQSVGYEITEKYGRKVFPST